MGLPGPGPVGGKYWERCLKGFRGERPFKWRGFGPWVLCLECPGCQEHGFSLIPIHTDATNMDLVPSALG